MGCCKCPKLPDNAFTRWLINNLFLITTILGVVIGIGLGVGLRKYDLSDLDAAYLKFPGEMLLRALKMLVLPLIIFSIISSIASLDRKTSGKLGGIAVTYYAITTFLAVIIGIIMCVAIKPGSFGSTPVVGTTAVGDLSPVDTILDIIRNLVPDNVVFALTAQIKTFRKVRVMKYDCTNEDQDFATIRSDPSICELIGTTKYELKSVSSGYNASQCSWSQDDFDLNKEFYACKWNGLGKEYASPRMNVLGILFFSIIVAIGITRIKDDTTRDRLITWFSGINEVIMMIVYVIIWYVPIGIIFLIAAEIIKMDDAETVFKRLGVYVGTVLGGLAIHFFIVLPLVFFFGTKSFKTRQQIRKFPLTYFRYIQGIGQAMLTALSTASSSATLPITIRCLETNNGIDRRIARFVLPIGATINMDGTALYEAVAAIFMAQYEGLDLNFGDYVVISITATIASIGAAGIPQAGLVTLIIVMTAIGLPPDRVSLILAVDWFLDRFRTSMNVTGDSIGCAVVQAWINLEDIDKEIEKIEDKQNSQDKEVHESNKIAPEV